VIPRYVVPTGIIGGLAVLTVTAAAFGALQEPSGPVSRTPTPSAQIAPSPPSNETPPKVGTARPAFCANENLAAPFNSKETVTLLPCYRVEVPGESRPTAP
jgi:hypothetical protein